MASNRLSSKEKKQVKINFKLSPEFFFSLLLGLVWAQSTLVLYFKAILLRIPYIHNIAEIIVSAIFIVVILFSLPYLAKHVDLKLILFYLAICLVYLLSLLVYHKNQEALKQNLIPFLINSLPMMFVGVSIDMKRHHKLLYSISLISVIIRFIHLLLEPNNVVNGDMHSSYLLLPHVCMVMAGAFAKTNRINVVASVIGILMILSFGSRGPILCLMMFVLLYLIFLNRVYRHMWLIFILTAAVLCIIFLYEEILQLLMSLVNTMGMSTRVFDLILQGEIFDSSGRDQIQAILLDAVKHNSFGYGIAGDRAIVGMYSHNLLIELWVSYGIFLGSVIFIIPVYLMLRLLIQKSKSKNIEDGFLLVLIASSFVKLFLSGSYLTEHYLYLLLGVVFAEYRKRTDNREISSPLVKKPA